MEPGMSINFNQVGKINHHKSTSRVHLVKLAFIQYLLKMVPNLQINNNEASFILT